MARRQIKVKWTERAEINNKTMNLLQGLGTCEQSHLSKMTWQGIKPWPLSQFCTPEISRSEIWSILGLGDCWNLLLHQKPLHYRRDKMCCYGARHNCFSICLAFSTEWHPSNTSKPPSAEQNRNMVHYMHSTGKSHTLADCSILLSLNLLHLAAQTMRSLHYKLRPSRLNRKHGFLKTT